MKKYLAITAALALVLTACGHAAPDSIPTLTAARKQRKPRRPPPNRRRASAAGHCGC